MRMIWEAIRAVTIETMGVGAVIFMLFGTAGLTVESAGVQPKQELDRAWHWVRETTNNVTSSVKPNLTVEQREEFAAERLNYYGEFFGEAVSSYAEQATERLPLRVKPVDHSPELPTNQLLGTL